MEACLQMFRSRAICENNKPFFLWAQVKAQDILNGKHDENIGKLL